MGSSDLFVVSETGDDAIGLIAQDILDSTEGTPFHDHPHGLEALECVVSISPEIGRGGKIGWIGVCQNLEAELGIVVEPNELRLLCEKKKLRVITSDSYHMRRLMAADVEHSKLLSVNEIADESKDLFMRASRDTEMSGRDKAAIGKLALTANLETHNLNAGYGIGRRVEKSPVVAVQNNQTINLADYFGDRPPPPRQADTVDAERV